MSRGADRIRCELTDVSKMLAVGGDQRSLVEHRFPAAP